MRTDGSKEIRFTNTSRRVWNVDNRVRFHSVTTSGVGWATGAGSNRIWGGSSLWDVGVLQGLSEDPVQADALIHIYKTSVGIGVSDQYSTHVAIDDLTVPATSAAAVAQTPGTGVGHVRSLHPYYYGLPGIGLSVFQPVEFVGAGLGSWFTQVIKTTPTFSVWSMH
jgi:hypothetical protein